MPLPESIGDFLNSAQVAIDNALSNAEVQNYLSELGYTPERIQEGKALYEAAVAGQGQRTSEYADQLGATAALEEARTKANKTYMRFLRIARVAFKDNVSATSALKMNGDRKKSLSGWLLQAGEFYDQALSRPEILNRLAEYNITAEKLEAGKAEVEAVKAANTAQETEKSEAQEATQLRDRALDALDDWLDDFLAIARIALEDSPQLAESLGLLVRS